MPQHPRILVVDDDSALREALAEFLEDRGYEVSSAGDGREALALLVERPSPDAILLDLAMPGMDGWTFRAAQLRDPRWAPIPTIVLSASLGTDARALAALAPTLALRKPFDLRRLLDALGELCSGVGEARASSAP